MIVLKITLQLLFLLWCFVFIKATSFIAIDGQRYFCLFDDAMISMRYAWNMVHGNGLVWNTGDYVQGYSNLLWTLLIAPVNLLDKPLAALPVQIAGVGIMLAIAFYTKSIAKLFSSDCVVAYLSFCCALSYYPLVYWSLMGMETGFLCLMVLLGAYYTLQNRAMLAALFMCLAFLTRSDSIVFAIPMFCYCFKWEAVCAYGLVAACLLLFQFGYYGDWLPNTYTLKLTGMSFQDRIINGWGFIHPFLRYTGPVMAAALIGLNRKHLKKQALLWSLIISAILYQVYVGGDPWAYWRIMSPVMPLLFILLVLAVLEICNTLPFSRPVKIFLMVALVLLGIVSANRTFWPEIMLKVKPLYVSANHDHINIALAINASTKPDATIGVLTAGVIPYFSGRKAIDFLGKSDRHIARLKPDMSGGVSWAGMTSVPGHNKYDLSYSIGVLKPNYVQSFTWGGKDYTSTNYQKHTYKDLCLWLIK